MSDFVQTMKDWRRMCENNRTDCMRFCPICANPTCGELAEADDEDILKAEDAIMAWAAEHPEPVYPSWYEWLSSMGIVPIEQPPEQAVLVTDIGLLKKIPAETAQKLGIEPKEG